MPAPKHNTASKRICIVTGTRAEYGLLETVIQAVQQHPTLELQLVAAGTHLITESINDITYPIAARVRMQRADETGRGADVQAVSRGIAGLGKAFDELKPDFVVVLGDRIEAFAAASAANIGGYRVVHMHGGDRAEGVADEAMRHAISKLAHLHLPATATSRRRLIRMGEEPARVINVGSPAIDALRQVTPAEDAPALIVMQHPIGESDEQERKWMDATLKATAKHDRIVMSPNHDPGRAGILAAIESHNIAPIDHLPRGRFLSLLAGARVIVGNSSAGLIEAAALRTAAVNLGPRQNGREKPRSVVDAEYRVRSTQRAVAQALNLDCSRLAHPYGKGDTGRAVADFLAEIDLQTVSVKKHNAY